MNSCSTFVAEFEVTFSSYEAIKTAVAEHCQDDYKVDPVQPFEREYKMHELSDACVFEFRNCVYMIKPVPGTPTKFMISSYTYWDATDLECFKACLTMLLKDLCENLDSQYQATVVAEEASLEEETVASLEEAVAVVNLVDLEIEAWIDKYIADNRIRSSNPTQVEEKNPLILDEDIYVFDGVNIYE